MAVRKIKSFTSSTKKKDVEPIPFELEGENFEAYGEVSGAVLLEFIAATDGDSTGKSASSILEYLENSMDADNYTRFYKIIHNPDVLVDIETLASIVSYLIEERTSRPTEAS